MHRSFTTTLYVERMNMYRKVQKRRSRDACLSFSDTSYFFLVILPAVPHPMRPWLDRLTKSTQFARMEVFKKVQ
jgi:hypothetical protein